jgi:perosamine synthetase
MKLIPISKPSITQEEIAYVIDAIQSGWVSSLGKYIELFESQFAQYCGTQYALTTSNGTVALHLALISLGIKEGDEVIIPDLTFIATANAVKYTGATVVPVDIEETTLCINPKAIESAITEKTKAIIPVHLYGHPANMSEINEIAKKHNLFVIEDAAEAHGAEINGKKVGGFGDCAIFSFYGNKIITSGEGGMITTNNKALYEKMKYLRDHAMSQEKRYFHTEIGFNYRMTNLQAALGLAQLERIDQLISKKIEIFEWYKKELGNVARLQLNRTANWAKNVYWTICLEIDGYTEAERNRFMTKLKENGIDTRPYFYPISDMPMYQSTNTPITHNIYQRGINLPSYFDLTQKEVQSISQTLVKIII